MFTHRLALALGLPRDEMLRRMDAAEFADWMAFYRAEPWDNAARADMRHAEMMALHANVNRDKKRRPKPYTPADFLPRRGDDEEAPDQRVRRKMQEYMAARATAFH